MISPGGLVATLFSNAAAALNSAIDATFNYVSLLLNGESALGTTKSAIYDASPNHVVVSPGPGTALRVDTFHPFAGTGKYSIPFSGGATYLTATSTAIMNFGTGDFTVEGWFNFPSAGTSHILNNNTLNGFALYTTPTSLIAGHTVTGNAQATPDITVAFVPTPNAWYHIAVSRASNTERVFINGVLSGSATVATNMAGATSNFIGYQSGVGYAAYTLSNFRVVKGTAVYTANFTVPTSPLTAIAGTSLLIAQDGYIKENSGNNYAITNTGGLGTSSLHPFAQTTAALTSGSLWFNGGTNGDQYIVSQTHPGFALGLNPFTIEFWSYMQGTGVQLTFGSSLAIVGTATSNRINAFGLTSSNNAWPTSVWVHICVQRTAGGALYLYANGVLVGSGTNTTNYTAADYVYIGGSNSGSSAMTGYISNVRIVNGYNIYATGGFTSPTSPLAAEPGTVLLTCQTAVPFNNKTFLDTSANDLAIIPTGTPTQGTFSPFSNGGWSTYFNNSRLTAPFTGTGTGSFTIEAWVNFDKATPTANETIVEFTGGALRMIWGRRGTDGRYRFYANGEAATGQGPVIGGGWNHVAIVKIRQHQICRSI